MLKTIICLIFCVLLNWSPSVANKCSFRGKCGEFTSGITGDTYPVPCVYSGDPKPFTQKNVSEEFRNLMPELFKDPNPVFCCDEKQVSDILEQMSSAKNLVQRCPSCYVNLAKIFFHMSCSPTQAEYIDVIKWNDTSDEVVELVYYVTDQFASGVFNSCKDVNFPAGSGKVIQMMCGEHSKDCTPKYFLDYLGHKDPSPMQIDFRFSNQTVVQNGTKTFNPLNALTVSCASALVSYASNPCSCVDCPIRCPIK